MKTGKPSESVLKRSIIKSFKNRRKEVIQGAGVGEDCALFSLEENMTAASVSTFSVLNSGFFSAQLMAAVNNVAASGAEPVALLISAVLPKDYEERELKALTTETEMVCQSLNIQAAGGDTRYSLWVLKPQISVTVLAKKSSLSTFAKKSSPGQDVVMTKWLGLAGTSFLVKQKREALKNRLPAGLLDEAEKFIQWISVLPEAALAVKSGIGSMHDVSRGGLFTALWELAEKDGIGLEIDIKKIPVRQETIEISEALGVNPYELYGAGSLLITCNHGEQLVNTLKKEGIPAAVIGRTCADKARIILNQEEKRYLDRPYTDNLEVLLI